MDPKLRGDRVQVRFDPFATGDTVQIYSLDGQYLGTGSLHHRDTGMPTAPDHRRAKPKHSYTDLLIRRHRQELAEKTGGIESHHLKFTLYRFELLRDVDVQMWVRTGDKPLITRLVLDLTRSLQGQALGLGRRAGRGACGHGAFDCDGARGGRQASARAGRVRPIEPNAPALGLFDDISAGPCPKVDVDEGDCLVCFTDGVVDRPDADGELYGIERLEELIRRTAQTGATATEIAAEIRADSESHAHGRPLRDDFTLLVAKF